MPDTTKQEHLQQLLTETFRRWEHHPPLCLELGKKDAWHALAELGWDNPAHDVVGRRG